MPDAFVTSHDVTFSSRFTALRARLLLARSPENTR